MAQGTKTGELTERQLTRLWGYVKKGDTPVACWLWQGTIGKNGYGYIGLTIHGEAKDYLAHRLLFFLHGGAVIPGTELDHLCMHKWCVNPTHLEPVSHQENARRAWEKLRPLAEVTCGQGHLLTEENVYQYTDPPRRECRLCAKERGRQARMARHTAGLCVLCGKCPARPDRKTCLSCVKRCNESKRKPSHA